MKRKVANVKEKKKKKEQKPGELLLKITLNKQTYTKKSGFLEPKRKKKRQAAQVFCMTL